MNFRSKSFLKSLAKWNNNHENQDIYIIGSSPQLLKLTSEHINFLKNKVVLGGNLTYLKVPLTYLMSSYPMHCLLAKKYLKASSIIKLNTPGEYSELDRFPEFAHFVKGPYSEAAGLSSSFAPGSEWISTHLNQSLGMTHLSMIMGARRVIYIGVEQGAHTYFWHKDPALKHRVTNLLYFFQSNYGNLLSDQKIKDVLRASFEMAAEDADSRDNLPFVFDHEDLFKAYFNDLRKGGVEPIATLRDSIIERAGARFVELDHLLKSG